MNRLLESGGTRLIESGSVRLLEPAGAARNIDYQLGPPTVAWRANEPETGWETGRPTLRSN